MLNYTFNESGVCINPNINFELDITECLLKINTGAISDGKWGYGIKFKINFGNCQFICWPLSKDLCNFPTQHAALLAATDEALRIIQLTRKQHHRQITSKFSCFRPFFYYHESIRQLSLF